MSGEQKKEEFTRILFEDIEKRNFVNNRVHPLVIAEREKVFKDLNKTGVYQFFIYESALMVESGSYKDFDKIIVVYTTADEQMKRLKARDSIDYDDAEKRIKGKIEPEVGHTLPVMKAEIIGGSMAGSYDPVRKGLGDDGMRERGGLFHEIDLLIQQGLAPQVGQGFGRLEP